MHVSIGESMFSVQKSDRSVLCDGYRSPIGLGNRKVLKMAQEVNASMKPSSNHVMNTSYLMKSRGILQTSVCMRNFGRNHCNESGINLSCSAASVSTTVDLSPMDNDTAAMEREENVKNILVVGASGRTGRRVIKQIMQQAADSEDHKCIGRDVCIFAAGRSKEKVTEALSEYNVRENADVSTSASGRLSAQKRRPLVLSSTDGDSAASSVKQNLDDDDNSMNAELTIETSPIPSLCTTILDINDSPMEVIRDAIDGIDTVVCCVGAEESPKLLIPEIFQDVNNNPMKVENEGVIKLIHAATACNVKKFILISSLGCGKFGFPASLLNFGGLLDRKREAEIALLRSGLDFTIIRPGGMERPTDEFALTHSTRLFAADTKFKGQISRMQVAEICAGIALMSAPTSTSSQTSEWYDNVSRNKIVEAVADEGKSKDPLMFMLDNIDSISSPIQANSLESFNETYAYEKSIINDPELYDEILVTFLDSMSFSGKLPELLNGRLAMLGFVEAIEAEMLGKGDVFNQVGHSGIGYNMMITIIIVLTVIGTIVPMTKKHKLEPSDANFGNFTAKNEMIHGRLAMIGFMSLLYVEHVNHMGILDLVIQKFLG